MTRIFVFVAFICLFASNINSQEIKYIEDTLVENAVKKGARLYTINDSVSYVYTRQRPFSYILNAWQDIYKAPMTIFKKENIWSVTGVTASSLLLIAFDEQISDVTQRFCRYINLAPTNNAKDISPINGMRFYVPTDLPSGLYYIGDGITELGVNSGFYIYGLVTKDPRALRTASELSEGMIATGVWVQFLKHITGRTTARVSKNEDNWRWFPSIKDYQKSVPSYDAFPSGHLSIGMMTATVITMNYPEKKFLKPVCYTLLGLCGFQMINNGVHWAGDYPLAFAMGYTIGKMAVNRGRMTVRNTHVNTLTPGSVGYKPEFKLKPAYLGYGASGLRFTMNF